MPSEGSEPTLEGQSWLEFEMLTARIYENLMPQGAEVTHNDHIRGHLSGIDRQIDVSIRFEVAGHVFLTIVQAKDISTPADVNVVGEFLVVVEDVKANKGVLVCRSGFTSAAHTLARAKGVDLCNIYEAASQRWALEIRVPILWVDLRPTVRFVGAVDLSVGDSIPASLQDWAISSDRGTTRVLALQTFVRMWNADELVHDVGPTHRIHDPSRKFWLLVQDAGGAIAWRPLDFALEYTVTRKSWLGSFSPSECAGLLHYDSGRLVGRFPIGSIPSERDDEWVEVEDPDQVVATISGSVVTSEGWAIEEGSGQVTDLVLRHVETGVELRPEKPGSERELD